MTNEQINRIIAEKVMGWTIAVREYFDSKDGPAVIAEWDWNPVENIEQALKALDEFCKKGGYSEVCGDVSIPTFYCKILTLTDKCRINIEYAPVRSEAICKALIKALEDKDV